MSQNAFCQAGRAALAEDRAALAELAREILGNEP